MVDGWKWSRWMRCDVRLTIRGGKVGRAVQVGPQSTEKDVGRVAYFHWFA